MKVPNFLILYVGFVICFTCGICGWQDGNDWTGCLLVGNALALFATHLIMAIYYIGENK